MHVRSLPLHTSCHLCACPTSVPLATTVSTCLLHNQMLATTKSPYTLPLCNSLWDCPAYLLNPAALPLLQDRQKVALSTMISVEATALITKG